MRIVFINQFYWPDVAATSQFLTDLTRGLAAEGHQIEVICGTAEYGPGDVLENPPSVKIHRVPTMPFSRSKFGKPLSYITFLLSALWQGLWMPRPDVVVTMTTPPMLSTVGAAMQRLRGVRHFIWAMDLFPEALVDIGMFQAKSGTVRLLGRIADFVYRRADGVIAIGECMRQRLRERNVPESKLHVVENWADGQSIFPIPQPRQGPIVVMYSGNLGLSHDIETLQYAMEALKDDDRFQFRFAGSGAGQTKVREWCKLKQSRNVTFSDYCSRARLAESLSEAEIGLVTQRSTSFGSVVPSKVYGLMAAGRPILYIGPRDTTPCTINERFRSGWNIECGDGEGLVNLLESLHSRRDLIQQAGARARDAFLAYYDMPQAVLRIGSLLGASVGTERMQVAGDFVKPSGF